MKRKINLAIGFAVITFIGANCGNINPSPASKSLADTSRIIGVFVDLKGEDIRHDIIYRVIKDSIKVDTANVMRNVVTRDSFYFLPVVDSLRDYTGKPLFDSTGKAIFTSYGVALDKEKVIDLGLKVDTAISKLGKFLSRKVK